MQRSAATRMSVLTAVLFAFVLAGCGTKESRWEGTYINAQDHSKMELKGDHKGTVTISGQPNDITWEVVSDEKITVHMATVPIEMLKTSDGMTDPQGVTWKKQ